MNLYINVEELIAASTSGTALHMCVSMHACLLAAIYRNFK